MKRLEFIVLTAAAAPNRGAKVGQAFVMVEARIEQYHFDKGICPVLNESAEYQ